MFRVSECSQRSLRALVTRNLQLCFMSPCMGDEMADAMSQYYNIGSIGD